MLKKDDHYEYNNKSIRKQNILEQMIIPIYIETV